MYTFARDKEERIMDKMQMACENTQIKKRNKRIKYNLQHASFTQL